MNKTQMMIILGNIRKLKDTNSKDVMIEALQDAITFEHIKAEKIFRKIFNYSSDETRLKIIKSILEGKTK